MKIIALLLLCLLPLLTVQSGEQDLSARLQASYQAGRWEEGIALARQLVRKEPENADLSYTLACLFSLSNQPDSALAWLEKAVRAGLTDYLLFQFDTDLDNIRQLSGYDRVLQIARTRAVAENQSKALDLTAGRWTPFTLGERARKPWIEGGITFDYDALRIRAEVHDTHFKDGDRSWRYGDGFTINFAVPDTADSVYSDRFHAFGFSLEKGQPTAVLINHDGTYFLKKVEALRPLIRVDRKRQRATYEITIPWTAVYPFHPLFDSQAGINIIYVSQGDSGSRKTFPHILNSMYDTETTPLRRYAPLRFHPADGAAASMTGRLKTRVISGNEIETRLTVWSPRDTLVNLTMTVSDANRQSVWTSTFAETLAAGENTISRMMPVPGAAGAYQCAAVLGDSLTWQELLYKYNPGFLATLEQCIADSHVAGEDLARRNSRHALRYRLRALKSHLHSFTPRSDLAELRREIEDLAELANQYAKQGTIYARGGYRLAAFESLADSTLQPFSIVLPDSFCPDSTYHLLVALHGSGVDEVGFAQTVAQSPLWREWIIVAPRGRNLSGWYLGQDEADALDLTQLATQMFHVDRTLCYGFSMGGYGAWRLTLLHPEWFDAAICVSGPTVAWGANREETDLSRHLDRPNDVQYLVIHGTEDKAVSIAQTDEFVARLREKRYAVIYVRVPGGGHGDFATRDIIEGWLHAQFPADFTR